MHEYDPVKKKKKKSKGNLLVGTGMLCYGSETDKALPVQQHPILDVTKYLFDGKTLHIEIGGQQPSELHLQASSKSEAKAIMVKISDSRTIAQKAGVRVAPESSTASPHHQQQQQDHEPTPAMPPRPTAAAAAPPPSPPEPESHPAIIMYTFAAEGGDEISVNEGDHVTVLMDDRQDGWCTIRTQRGEQGIVPETYVEMQDHDNAAPTTINEQRPSIPDPMAIQRQREEELLRRQQQEEERAQRARERQEEEERQQAAKREQEENERRRKLQEAAQRAEVMRQRQLQQSKATVSYIFECLYVSSRYSLSFSLATIITKSTFFNSSITIVSTCTGFTE